MTARELRDVLEGVDPDLEVLVQTDFITYKQCRAEASEGVYDPKLGWYEDYHDPMPDDEGERRPAVIITVQDETVWIASRTADLPRREPNIPDYLVERSLEDD